MLVCNKGKPGETAEIRGALVEADNSKSDPQMTSSEFSRPAVGAMAREPCAISHWWKYMHHNGTDPRNTY